MNLEPIIVTGGPRSGTTLTMRLLHRAGLQLGTHAEMNELREGRIRDELYKPILAEGGFDPLAQSSLPPVGWECNGTPDWLRQRVLELSQVEDRTRPWGFKAIKGVLFYRSLIAAFPGARWVIVKRDRDEHVASLLRTPFMTVHDTAEGWNRYMDEVDLHLDAVMRELGSKCFVFRPASVRDGYDGPLRDLCAFCGLSYTESCLNEFNPNLYRS